MIKSLYDKNGFAQELTLDDAVSISAQGELRDRSLFMEEGEGNFFFPKFLKLKAPP
jgi:hypothetical protein